jgi:hypothetical protein
MKVRLKKKKYSFSKKKIKSAFKGLKSLKIAKTNFWQKFKNKSFAIFIYLFIFYLKFYFSNIISNKLLEHF